MADTDSTPKRVLDVSLLNHHEDLEKVSDIIESICEEKNVIGFRFTYKPATANDVIRLICKPPWKGTSGTEVSWHSYPKTLFYSYIVISTIFAIIDNILQLWH